MIKPQIHGVYKKFPWIRWIPFQFYKRLYKLVQKIKKDLQKELLFDLRVSKKVDYLIEKSHVSECQNQ